ncbi:MAG: EAL domain-containing protein [Armatimonadetes bacterium]|nr:EAL domain-containing protein [Armatimonadota bacterium]
MTLRVRLYLLIGFLILGSALVLYLTAKYVLMSGFSELESASVKTEVGRAASAIEGQELGLQSTTRDYSQWDDTYQYVKGRDSSFVKKNLDLSYISTLDVDAVIISDSNGKVMFSELSVVAKREKAQIKQISDLVSSQNLLSKQPNPIKSIKGIVSVGKHTYIVASAPILHSDGSGPVAGRFVFLRGLDAVRLTTLSKQTAVKIKLYPFSETFSSPQLASIASQLNNNTSIATKFPNDSTACGYTLLRDTTGKPTALLQTSTNRKVHSQALRSSKYLIFLTTVFIVIFGLLTIMLLNKAIFRKLNTLSNEISALSQGSDQMRMTCEGNDEISAVARVMNVTLDRLQESQNKLRNEHAKLAITLASIGDAVIATDDECIVTFINNIAEQITGFNKADALGMSVFDIFSLTDEDTLAPVIHPIANAIIMRSITSLPDDIVLIRNDGIAIPIDDSASPIIDGDGQLIGAIMVFRDVSERRAVDHIMRENEARMRLQVSAINAAGDHILILNPQGSIVFANKAFEQDTGHSLSELEGKGPEAFMFDDTKHSAYKKMWAEVSQGKYWRGELLHKRKTGEDFFSQITFTPLLDEAGKVEHIVAIGRDITDRKSYEEILDRQARYDPLTGLPNRLMFTETLSAMINSHKKSGANLGLIFLDMDRFKNVNDTHGHDAGDLLLIEIGRRIKDCLRNSDVLCRMGGDEFTVILRRFKCVEDVRLVADRILNEISRPFIIQNQEFNIGSSIGVSIYPSDAQDFNGIVKNADTAMYRAKELGRNNCQFYNAEMDAATIHKQKTEQDLRQAIAQGELEIYYQPRINPLSSARLGAEALLRWNHPERGLVPASAFIMLAEESGLIIAIGEYALNLICDQQKEWLNAGYEPMPVAINLSEKQVFRTDFLEKILDRVQKNELNPSLISLELPGKAFLYISEPVLYIIEQMREIGVKLTLDDFSNGPISMNDLKNLPIDSLKIDKRVLEGAMDNVGDVRVAASVASTARNLGLELIAVGVENDLHLKLASDLLCDVAQGYLIGHPMPAKDYEKSLSKRIDKAA